MKYLINIISVFLFLILSDAALAWDTLTPALDLRCNQSEETNLQCDYRLLKPGLETDISAVSGTEKLNILSKERFPGLEGTAAILFVVDTSDPARQNVIDKNIMHIEELLSARQQHHRFGLASFDKHLRVDAPVGSSGFQIINASKRLRATGKTTELYRNVIQAIDIIAGEDSDRKAIYLFSDGQAEDRAYYHEDVVKIARSKNVIINSLGYPRSVSLSVALQTIRRLSEETGGIFVETDSNFNLPFSFLDSPYSNINTGGKLLIDLQPLIKPGAAGEGLITLNINTSTGKIITRVPYTNSMAVPPNNSLSENPAAITTEQQADVIRYERVPQQPGQLEKWLWYGLPVAFLILIALTLVILVVLYRQQTPAKSKGKTPLTEYKPYAYLVVQDESRMRYPITNTTWRIGRTRDNELTLNDKSVSRRHAEIQRYSNGNFVIFDVDSLNGVYVNSEQIKKKKLNEGDILEIGDFVLRFTTYSNDFHIEEDTAVQDTRAPVAH